MAVYSTQITRTKAGASLEITEDILYGGVRVNGVELDITPEPGARLGSLSHVVTGNIHTALVLQQDVDVLYDGVVVGHISVHAEPDPEIGHSVSIETRWVTDVPFLIQTDITG